MINYSFMIFHFPVKNKRFFFYVKDIKKCRKFPLILFVKFKNRIKYFKRYFLDITIKDDLIIQFSI